MQFSSNCPPYSLIKCYYHCMISFVFFFSKWNFISKLGKIVRLVVGIPRYMVLIMGMLFLLLSKSLWFVFFLVVIAIHRWALHQVDIKMSFFLVILVRNLHKTTSWICCLGRVYSLFSFTNFVNLSRFKQSPTTWFEKLYCVELYSEVDHLVF